MVTIKEKMRSWIRDGEHKELQEAWVLIAVDDVADLTVTTARLKFSQGSLALVVNTGEIYALNSKNEWKIQSNLTVSI